MKNDLETLHTALLSFVTFRTPGRISSALRTGGRSDVMNAALQLDNATRVDIEAKANRMHADGIGAVIFGTRIFPNHWYKTASR